MTPQGPIRLTLDEGLQAVTVVAAAFEPRTGQLILPDRVVLELKFRFPMPATFKRLVGEFCLRPQRFSKYRQAALALGLAGDSAWEPEPAPEVQHGSIYA